MNFSYFAIGLRSGTKYEAAFNEMDAVILAQAEAIKEGKDRTVLWSNKIAYELYTKEKYKIS